MEENDISYKKILDGIINLSNEYKRFIKLLAVIIIALIILNMSMMRTMVLISDDYKDICNNAVDAYLREDYGWPETNIEQNTNVNTKE